MIFLTDHLVMRRLRGFCFLVCGFLLCLPLPIPFTNMVPAVTVMLFAASMIEKDGYFILAGIVMFIARSRFSAQSALEVCLLSNGLRTGWPYLGAKTVHGVGLPESQFKC